MTVVRVSGRLRLGEAADVPDHLLEPGPNPRRQGVAGGLHLGPRYQERSVGAAAAVAPVGLADRGVAAGLDRLEDGPGALADTPIRHRAPAQQGLDLGGDGGIGAGPREVQAAQADGGGGHETSFSMGRIRMPEAPAALSCGSSAQTWLASITA